MIFLYTMPPCVLDVAPAQVLAPQRRSGCYRKGESSVRGWVKVERDYGEA